MSILGTIVKGAEGAYKGIETGVNVIERGAASYAPKVKEPHPQQLTEAQAVLNAANKWHINPEILWGVYGAETSHGSDVKTSSTGARGPFQFEPETAKQYGYPYGVNENGVTNMAAFAKQADAAAHYLSALLPGGKGETAAMKGAAWNTAWNTALQHYSGGGYGLAHVQAEGKSLSGNFGTSFQNQEETRKVEEGPTSPTGKFGELGLMLVLMLAGAILLIYGVAVAVRPQDKAFSSPFSGLVNRAAAPDSALKFTVG